MGGLASKGIRRASVTAKWSLARTTSMKQAMLEGCYWHGGWSMQEQALATMEAMQVTRIVPGDGDTHRMRMNMEMELIVAWQR